MKTPSQEEFMTAVASRLSDECPAPFSNKRILARIVEEHGLKETLFTLARICDTSKDVAALYDKEIAAAWSLAGDRLFQTALKVTV